MLQSLLIPPLVIIMAFLDEEKAKLDPGYHLKSTNMETRETLAELYRDYKGDQLLASTSKEPEAKKTDKLNAVSKHIITVVYLEHFIDVTHSHKVNKGL